MKETFDFRKIGKRMPYKVPQGFFDTLEENVQAEVGKEVQKAPRRFWPMPVLWRTIGAAAIAACATLLLVFNWEVSETDKINSQMLDNAFCALSAEDQTCLLDIYQADIFIDDDNETSIQY